jgi:tRNA acetyltransferase TAN1
VIIVEFNFIATTFRFKEDDLVDEIKELFYEFGDLYAAVRTTHIDGLVVGLCSKDPIDFIVFLRDKLKDAPWDIRYLLRFIPVEKVVLANLSELKNISVELVKKVSNDESFKILVEKRHTNLKKIDIINEIAPLVSAKVDLETPIWILLIEIIGKYAGVSVIKTDSLFSSMIEKRSLE